MSIEDMNKPCILTIQNGYGTYSVSENHSQQSVDDMYIMFRHLLLAAGYEPQSIDDYLGGN